MLPIPAAAAISPLTTALVTPMISERPPSASVCGENSSPR
jgi:hypothetical protein